MLIYIFGTATEEQLGYKLPETENSDAFRGSRVQNLTNFCLKKKKSNQRESKLSLVAKINQKTVGVCLIPKAASTTLRMVSKLGWEFLKLRTSKLELDFASEKSYSAECNGIYRSDTKRH